MRKPKSLDDVIKAQEICDSYSCGFVNRCPYTEFDENGNWKSTNCSNCHDDVIYYLKELQEIMNRTRTERLIEVLREVRGEI